MAACHLIERSCGGEFHAGVRVFNPTFFRGYVIYQNFHFGTQVAASIHLIASFATVKSEFPSLGASVPTVCLKGGHSAPAMHEGDDKAQSQEDAARRLHSA
jgi:hypothetical protein